MPPMMGAQYLRRRQRQRGFGCTKMCVGSQRTRGDSILCLGHGWLVEQGTHDELRLLGGRYADLFDLQAASYR